MALLTLAIVVGAVLGLLGLVLGGNFTLELLEGDDPEAAWQDTQLLAVGILGAFAGLVATGFIQLGGLVDGFAELLGTSPIALTNVFSIGMGWLGITGTVDLGPGLFLAATIGFLGLAFLAKEVKA